MSARFPHVAVLLVLATSGLVTAEDTGWRQPGVRVWYVGASASYSGQSDVEEANLIERAGAGLRVVRHSGVGFWESPLPAEVLPAPDPEREGPFWIAPRRLRALRPPDAFSWQGLSLVVKARVTYRDPADLPFIAFLPVQALYRAGAPRELITLTGDNDGVVGDYFFDVETGLGLSATLATPGFYIVRMLSEINYDFATGESFAEDDGPHTGYRARQMGGRFAFPVNQLYFFEEHVLSRYGPSVRADLILSLDNIATGASWHADYAGLFDGTTRQFFVTPIVALGAAANASTENGTHPFFWVPPGDLGREAIRVWDVDLTRREPAGSDVVFAADQLPATGWGFTRLQLDPQGFLREMTIASPAMGIEIDTRTATTREHELTGRAYYLETMGLAVPGPPDARDLGLMKMKAPKRVVLKGVPVTKTVSVRLQNHGARTEIVEDRTALGNLVTVEAESLGACAPPVASLRSPSRFPLTLPPRKTHTVVFSVVFDCANDPLPTSSTAAHWDYRWVARLHPAADADAHDDACPHDAPPGRVDPIDARVKDTGCGARKTGKLRGADVFTDVVEK